MLRGLVEQRGHQSNQIKDQNICINLTREANKSLSVAAKLNLPIKILEFRQTIERLLAPLKS